MRQSLKNGRNKIEIVIGCMDLDYALREYELTKPNYEITNEQKVLYEKWKCSNLMSLMIMKDSIIPTIRGLISDSNNVMSYMKLVEEQFLGISKSLEITLMIKMITMTYNHHTGVHEHIMKMSDIYGFSIERNEHDNF